MDAKRYDLLYPLRIVYYYFFLLYPLFVIWLTATLAASKVCLARAWNQGKPKFGNMYLYRVALFVCRPL